MGNTLMSIMVMLGLDTKEYEEGLDKAQKKTTETTKSLSSTFSNVGASMMKVGGIMTATVTAPIVAGALKSIEAASDLGESINAVGVVFGDNKDEILAFGESAATTVGMSNREFNQLATTTGAFLQNVGFDAAGAAQETIKLTERASDMASVFNTDVSTALGAIQSGLKGEFNPLEQFGVKMNAAMIEAKALEMGLAGAAKELTDSDKATAALALTYEQTSKYAGDFINTSDSLANSTKIAKGQLEDAAAALGEKLIPLATTAVGWISQLVTAFTNLPAPVQNTILVIAGIVAVVGPLLLILGSLFSAIGAISAFLAGPAVAAIGTVLAAAAPIIAIVLAIIAVIALLYIAWQSNFLGIQDITAAIVQYIITRWQDFLSEIKAVWSWLNTVLFPFFKALADFIGAVFNYKLRELQNEWKAVQKAVEPIYQFIKANLLPIFKEFTDWLSSTFGPIIEGAADVLRNAFGSAFEWISQKIQEVTKWLQDLTNWVNGLGGGGDTGATTSESSASVSGPTDAFGADSASSGGNTYNIFTSDNPGKVTQALTLSGLMGGAA